MNVKVVAEAVGPTVKKLFIIVGSVITINPLSKYAIPTALSAIKPVLVLVLKFQSFLPFIENGLGNE